MTSPNTRRRRSFRPRPRGGSEAHPARGLTDGRPHSEQAVVSLLGVPLSRTTEDQVISTVLAKQRDGLGGWLCPVNLDVLRQINGSSEIRSLVEEADLVVADGMPLLWASRIARAPLPERVAGSTLVSTLAQRAAEADASIFLLGGNPGTAELAASKLVERNPGLAVAGTHCPPFGFESNEEAMTQMTNELRETKPDIVFVGLGFPKQERLIQRLRQEMPTAWFVSVGVSFSFVSGEIQRAPSWIQDLGLEWVHRMAQEPRRLFRRYVVDGIPFVTILAGHAVRLRFRS